MDARAFCYLAPLMSDTELIDRLTGDTSNHENEALRYIYKQYFGLVRSVVLKNRGTEEDAKEVFQEGIIALHRSIKSGKFRGESALSSYLYAICRLLWLKKLKKNGQTPLLAGEPENFSQLVAFDESEVIWTERNVEQENAIGYLFSQLGEQCRKILRLYYFEQQSMKQISIATGYKDEQNVRNKKAKCLNALRDLINTSPGVKNRLLDAYN
jgi:RNA polymerase sigma factor (sigma-70 family)